MIRDIRAEEIRAPVRDYSYPKPDPIVERRSDCLSYEAFIKIAEWKTERQKARYPLNRGYVEDVTALAFRQTDEARKIALLCTMNGVHVPVASALLHFGHDASYPIMDRYAVQTLWRSGATACQIWNWPRYVDECRAAAAYYGVSVRDLDKALWQLPERRR